MILAECYYEDDDSIISKINENTVFQDLGLDSIDMTDMIIDIEEEFDIEIDISEMAIDSESTIGDIVDFIKSKIKE